jgi:hypothetical protein
MKDAAAKINLYLNERKNYFKNSSKHLIRINYSDIMINWNISMKCSTENCFL